MQKGAPAYKNLPTTTEEKRDYAIKHFKNDIKLHFEKEERLYQSIFHYPELQILIEIILNDHRKLTRLFTELETSVTLERLDEVGLLLERHIRTEERELFPMMEKICTSEELAGGLE